MSKDFGIKASQDGKDVKDNVDSEMILNSNFNMFKIVTTGTATVTVPNPIASNTRVTTTIFHGLGIRPSFVVFVTIPSYGGYTTAGQLTSVPATIWGSIGEGFGQAVLIGSARVDDTSIYFDVYNPTGISLSDFNGDWLFKYYILQETAE